MCDANHQQLYVYDDTNKKWDCLSLSLSLSFVVIEQQSFFITKIFGKKSLCNVEFLSQRREDRRHKKTDEKQANKNKKKNNNKERKKETMERIYDVVLHHVCKFLSIKEVAQSRLVDKTFNKFLQKFSRVTYIVYSRDDPLLKTLELGNALEFENITSLEFRDGVQLSPSVVLPGSLEHLAFKRVGSQVIHPENVKNVTKLTSIVCVPLKIMRQVYEQNLETLQRVELTGYDEAAVELFTKNATINEFTFHLEDVNVWIPELEEDANPRNLSQLRGLEQAKPRYWVAEVLKMIASLPNLEVLTLAICNQPEFNQNLFVDNLESIFILCSKLRKVTIKFDNTSLQRAAGQEELEDFRSELLSSGMLEAFHRFQQPLEFVDIHVVDEYSRIVDNLNILAPLLKNVKVVKFNLNVKNGESEYQEFFDAMINSTALTCFLGEADVFSTGSRKVEESEEARTIEDIEEVWEPLRLQRERLQEEVNRLSQQRNEEMRQFQLRAEELRRQRQQGRRQHAHQYNQLFIGSTLRRTVDEQIGRLQGQIFRLSRQEPEHLVARRRNERIHHGDAHLQLAQHLVQRGNGNQAVTAQVRHATNTNIANVSTAVANESTEDIEDRKEDSGEDVPTIASQLPNAMVQCKSIETSTVFVEEGKNEPKIVKRLLEFLKTTKSLKNLVLMVEKFTEELVESIFGTLLAHNQSIQMLTIFATRRIPVTKSLRKYLFQTKTLKQFNVCYEWCGLSTRLDLLIKKNNTNLRNRSNFYDWVKLFVDTVNRNPRSFTLNLRCYSILNKFDYQFAQEYVAKNLKPADAASFQLKKVSEQFDFVTTIERGRIFYFGDEFYENDIAEHATSILVPNQKHFMENRYEVIPLHE